MNENAFYCVFNDKTVNVEGDASWDQFYWGPVAEMDAAIEALLRGDEGAEAKFEFPWDEVWKDGGVEIRIGILYRKSWEVEDEEEEEDDGVKGKGERTYVWGARR